LQAALVAYCRAGFEGEAAADLHRAATRARAAVEVEARAGHGYVIAAAGDTERGRWHSALEAAPPIFARSVFVGAGPYELATAHAQRVDRATPLLAAIGAAASPPWRSVWVEYPDTNEGKSLSPLARALQARLDGALGTAFDSRAGMRLHAFLPDGRTAFVGASRARDNDWPMGIPRLRMPGGAPSRSTLKLAEAFDVFLGERSHELLRAGMRAVDLGAAPGGWTWQLAQRGVAVTAVDNGPLRGAVRDDPLVTHVREDAFRWRPRRPVEWLVCDVVEQPIRVATLVAQWMARGDARRAIFNLKLPMKRRYDEVRRCAARVEELLAGTRHALAVRHLYHDREEVTAYLARD